MICVSFVVVFLLANIDPKINHTRGFVVSLDFHVAIKDKAVNVNILTPVLVSICGEVKLNGNQRC